MIGRNEKVRVGLFLILCVAIAVGSVLALAGLRTKHEDLYAIMFEESVSGLDEASFVRYQGKKVGRVKSIGIDPDTDWPLITIAVAPGTPIKADTRARLETQSMAAGTRYIELKRGDPEAAPLPAGSRIRASFSSFAQIEAFGAQAGEVLDNLRGLIDDETKREVRNLLANVDRAVGQTSDRLAVTQAGVDEGIASARTALAEAEALLKESRPRVQGAIAALERGSDALAQMAETAKQKQLVEGAADAIASLKAAADALARVADRADRVLGRNGGAIDEILANLRQSSRDLAEVAREVKERPSLLLRDLDRGERSGRD